MGVAVGGRGVGVFVGVAVGGIGVSVAVGVGDCVDVGMGVTVGVNVAVAVGDGVAVGVFVGNGVEVGVGDGVEVGVLVAVGDGDGVEVGVFVGDGVDVGASVLVGDGAAVGTAIGAAAIGTGVGDSPVSEHPAKIAQTARMAATAKRGAFKILSLPPCRPMIRGERKPAPPADRQDYTSRKPATSPPKRSSAGIGGVSARFSRFSARFWENKA